MTQLIQPMPYESPVLASLPNEREHTEQISENWYRWLFILQGRLQAAAYVIGAKALTTQNAAISATPFTLPVITGGVYRVSYYVRVTSAAGTSSSVQVTLGWTDGGVSLTKAGTAVTGNTTSSFDQGSVLVRDDANGPITYATSYASNPANAMQYALDVVVEAVS